MTLSRDVAVTMVPTCMSVGATDSAAPVDLRTKSLVLKSKGHGGVSRSTVMAARVTLWVLHGAMGVVAVFALLGRPVPLVGWEFQSPVLFALGLFFVGAPLATLLVKVIFAAIFGSAAHVTNSLRSRPSSKAQVSASRKQTGQSSTGRANAFGRGAASVGDEDQSAGAYGYLEADVEVELVRIDQCQAALAKIMKADAGVRRRLEGLARLGPSVARAPGERDAWGHLMTRVAVEFEGVRVGYLPDEVALAVAHNLRRFTAEEGLDVYCPSQIVAGSHPDGGAAESFGVSVWLDARHSHQPVVVGRPDT